MPSPRLYILVKSLNQGESKFVLPLLKIFNKKFRSPQQAAGSLILLYDTYIFFQCQALH